MHREHIHKLPLTDWRDIRDRWTQSGENHEERTLIKLHRHQERFPRAILRIGFNLAPKKKERKRQCCVCYPPCTRLSPCPSAASTLAWQQGFHSPSTRPHSMPAGTDHRGACVVALRHRYCPEHTHTQSLEYLAVSHLRSTLRPCASWPLRSNSPLCWILWWDFLGFSPNFPAKSFWLPSADSPRAPSSASLLSVWPLQTILCGLLASLILHKTCDT